MAAGEYVSVHSQADAENADLARERKELSMDPGGEHEELADIYVGRGLDRDLATQVAQQLMARNALQAHARDELGITEALSARPVQAALASAASFAVGGTVPLLMASLSPLGLLAPFVTIVSLLCLAILGSVAAKVGGAPILKGAMRVVFWGALAMAATAGVGAIFGTTVQQASPQ